MTEHTNTISSVILKAFRENMDRIAIRRNLSQAHMTYGELYDQACRVAAFLADQGIEPGKGNRVAISMNRDPGYVASFMGCLVFGYAAVLLDSEYPESRKNYILQHSAAQFVLDEENYCLAMECEPAEMRAAPEENTDALIVYTSGSSGNPKGILHSQKSCGQAVLRLKDMGLLTSQDHYGATARFTFAVHCSDLLLPLCSGCSVSIIPLDVTRDPQMLAVYCHSHDVTATFMPPSLFKTFDRASDTLKTVIVSGEKVFNVDPKGMRVVATYGMSEGYVLLADEVKECSENAYLGKPIGDIGAYVLDEDGNEAEEGELCVSGSLFTGYLELPDLTSQVLTDNPFRGRDGHEKLFHTRDFVRRLPDGRLLYVDRMDWMVKINGNRVELGEIESILRSLPEVRDVLVKGFSDPQGHVFLCAYYIAQSGAEIPKQYLVEKLSKKVPSYMIPAFFVRMEAFPKNANGKLDRKSLAMPDINDFRNDYVPPANDMEAKICQAMERVLGIGLIGVNDDFFDLGGDSLRSAVLISDLGDHGLTYSTIFDGRTPRRIAQLMTEANAQTRTIQMAMEARSRPQPLLPYQSYYLDYQMYSPNKILVTNPLYCRLPRETASPEAVKEALEKVFRHFAVFGTVFDFDRNTELVQRYEPSRIPEIEITYVSEAAFENEVKASFVRPFRLFNSILWRCGVFVTPENTYILMDIYHAISDRWMVKNLFRNVFKALAGETLDDDYYYLYLHEQGKLRKTAASYSGEALKLLEAAQSYSGFPRPDFESGGIAYGLYTGHIDHTLRELRCAADRYRCSLNNLFIAAGVSALGQYNKESRVKVRWTYHNRDEAWKKPLVGIVTESITTNMDFQTFDSEEKIIQEVKRQAMLGMRYSAISAAFIDLSPGLSERMNIVYQQGKSIPENTPEGAVIQPFFTYHTASQAMFQIMINEQGEDQPLQLIIVYNQKRYKAESVDTFAALYRKDIGNFLAKAPAGNRVCF